MFASRTSAHSLSLTAPFAAIGAAGGWMLSDFLRAGVFSVDAGLRPLLVLSTPIVAATMGLVVGSRAGTSRAPRLALSLGFAGAAAGVCTGAVIGVLLWPPAGLMTGAAFGLASGSVFGLVWALVASAARRVGRARAGSIVDASDRRGVWRTVAMTIACGTLAALPNWPRYRGVGSDESSITMSFALGILALGVVAAIFAHDLADFLGALRTVQEQPRMRRREVDDDRRGAGRIVDLGLGEGEAEVVEAPSAIYRGLERVHAVVRGNAESAARALGFAALRGAFALVLSVTAVLVALAQHDAARHLHCW